MCQNIVTVNWAIIRDDSICLSQAVRIIRVKIPIPPEHASFTARSNEIENFTTFSHRHSCSTTPHAPQLRLTFPTIPLK